MEPQSSNTGGASTRPKLHPLVAAAAIALIVLSAVGISTLLYNRSSATAGAPAVAQGATNSADVANAAGTAPPNLVASAQSGSNPPVYDYPPATQAPAQPQAQAAVDCRDCAVVESVSEIKVKGQGTGVGAVGGGVVGGLIGNSVGGGRGRGALTVLGVVGGALAGNQIEKNARSTTQYRMVVRYENGTTREFTRTGPWPYASGDRVKVVNGQVIARN